MMPVAQSHAARAHRTATAETGLAPRIIRGSRFGRQAAAAKEARAAKVHEAAESARVAVGTAPSLYDASWELGKSSEGRINRGQPTEEKLEGNLAPLAFEICLKLP